MKTLSTALALVIGLGAVPALAANARQPYANVDRRIDRGNDTGDSRVPDLNQQSLDRARSENSGVVYGAPVLGAPVYAPPGPTPPGYVPVAPVYPGAPR